MSTARVSISFALLLGLAACDDQPTRPVATEAPSAPARVPVEALRQTAQSVEEPSAPQGCPHVVLDPAPPLRVRSSPSTRGESVGGLGNGTQVMLLETRGAWARIEAPVAGWVYRANLYDECDAPAVLPAFPLGEHTYLLLPDPVIEGATPGTRLPPPPVEATFVKMQFSWRDPVPVPHASPVTLVTTEGSCSREVIRQVTLVGTCSEDTDYGVASATGWHALEVRSCDELTQSDDEAFITSPRLAGVFGEHPLARIAPAPLSEVPLTPAQERVLDRMVADVRAEFAAEGVPDDPLFTGRSLTGERVGTTRIVLTRAGEDDVVFHGDTKLGVLFDQRSDPMQIRQGSRTLALLGSGGFHGYMFYTLPNQSRPGQIIEASFPGYTCGPH